MLDTLPRLPHANLPTFLNTLTPLCTSHPTLFAPHLSALLAFLPALILPSPSEAKPSMVRRQDGRVPVVVRGCLEGMGEFPEDQASLDSWLEADVSSSLIVVI